MATKSKSKYSHIELPSFTHYWRPVFEKQDKKLERIINTAKLAFISDSCSYIYRCRDIGRDAEGKPTHVEFCYVTAQGCYPALHCLGACVFLVPYSRYLEILEHMVSEEFSFYRWDYMFFNKQEQEDYDIVVLKDREFQNKPEENENGELVITEHNFDYLKPHETCKALKLAAWREVEKTAYKFSCHNHLKLKGIKLSRVLNLTAKQGKIYLSYLLTTGKYGSTILSARATAPDLLRMQYSYADLELVASPEFQLKDAVTDTPQNRVCGYTIYSYGEAIGFITADVEHYEYTETHGFYRLNARPEILPDKDFSLESESLALLHGYYPAADAYDACFTVQYFRSIDTPVHVLTEKVNLERFDDLTSLEFVQSMSEASAKERVMFYTTADTEHYLYKDFVAALEQIKTFSVVYSSSYLS